MINMIYGCIIFHNKGPLCNNLLFLTCIRPLSIGRVWPDCNRTWKNESFLVSLSCLNKPVDGLFEMFNAAGLRVFFVKGLGSDFPQQNPKNTTLCLFSSASSQCLFLLCYQRATVADVSLENGVWHKLDRSTSSATQKLHRAPLIVWTITC